MENFLQSIELQIKQKGRNSKEKIDIKVFRRKK
jgi:hypothetical protein